MLASPGPFHPQMAAAMHRPETTNNPSSMNPAALVGFKPLGADQHNQSDDRDEDDVNGSEMDSDVGSDNDDVNDIDSDKLDASHREILEKLKRQELEEREEIERELKEAQREALLRAQRHEELRAREEKERAERGVDDVATPLQTEIKLQRPLGLLAQHGLATKGHPIEREHRNDADDDDGKDDKDADGAASPADRGQATKGDGDKFDRERPMPLTIPLPGPNLDFGHPAFLDSRGFSLGPSPPHPESPRSAGTPGLDGSGSTGAQTPAGHHWTFEEQFKQLYELSDEPKRKEFLDDLFSFMQKRGTPVNRIPIMAKQTLDLYELFRLVVSKGGLVEVINKKLWREITKGLNLPSSITSAAFTLRTQYMKYLYPFECERLKLSNPAELQAAIDGNRREGRRPSYGYDFSPIPTMIPTPPTPHLNGGFPPHALNGRPNLSTPPKDSPTDLKIGKENSGIWNLKTWSDSPLDLKMGKENSAVWNLKTWSDDDHPIGPVHLASLAERDARAMEAAAKAMEEATKRMEEASRGTSIAPAAAAAATTKTTTSTSTPTSTKHAEPLGQPPLKRPLLDDDRFMAHFGMPSAHLKITSRGDGRSEFDNSLVVSMEINGVMYQGVLFAQHGHPRRI